MSCSPLHEAVCQLRDGKVIAYATEAVFGLGCDPDNQQAVLQLLNIKQRPIEKGLILVAATWEQLQPYIDIDAVPEANLASALASWPGPFTWVMPAATKTPRWLTGQFSSLAVRISAHPQVQALCREFGKPIVSTSANLTGYPPCRTAGEVQFQLSARPLYVLAGTVSGSANPSQILDVMTGQILRPA
jgi:L-threonylcarbamoyladenylate synthase